MRNVMVAFASFIAGFLCSPLSPIHTSTVLHAQAFATNAGAVPVIPSVPLLEADHNMLEGVNVSLDCFATKDSVLKDVTLVYGGGAYQLENVTITGTVGIKLFGAAGNGAALLARFGLLGCPSRNTPPPATKPNTPMTMEAKMVDFHGILSSPFGQK
jgi:hypothetical protein